MQAAVTDVSSQTRLDKDTVLFNDQLRIRRATFEVTASRNFWFLIIYRPLIQLKSENASNTQSSDDMSNSDTGTCYSFKQTANRYFPQRHGTRCRVQDKQLGV